MQISPVFPAGEQFQGCFLRFACFSRRRAILTPDFCAFALQKASRAISGGVFCAFACFSRRRAILTPDFCSFASLPGRFTPSLPVSPDFFKYFWPFDSLTPCFARFFKYFWPFYTLTPCFARFFKYFWPFDSLTPRSVRFPVSICAFGS